MPEVNAGRVTAKREGEAVSLLISTPILHTPAVISLREARKLREGLDTIIKEIEAPRAPRVRHRTRPGT